MHREDEVMNTPTLYHPASLSPSISDPKKDTASPLQIGLFSFHFRQERWRGQRSRGIVVEKAVVMRGGQQNEASVQTQSCVLHWEGPKKFQSQLYSIIGQAVFNAD